MKISLKGRKSEFFPLWAVLYSMENQFYHIKWPPLNVTILLHKCVTCVMGATPMISVTPWLLYFSVCTLCYHVWYSQINSGTFKFHRILFYCGNMNGNRCGFWSVGFWRLLQRQVLANMKILKKSAIAFTINFTPKYVLYTKLTEFSICWVWK